MDREENKRRSIRYIAGEKRKLLREVRTRQKKWMEEVLRGSGMLKAVIEGRMLGKRGRGRRRIGILDNMKGGRKYVELKREIAS